MTAHCIEETALTKWELKNTLISFTRIANAHSGEWLGQVLFKIVERVSIQHKVSVWTYLNSYADLCLQLGHITCDNASNNGTMMQELANRIKHATKKKYDHKKRKIKCMPSLFQAISCIDEILKLSHPCHQLGDTSSDRDAQQITAL